jgi:hypothetical protein
MSESAPIRWVVWQYGMPVFVLDDHRSIWVLDAAVDGFRILFGFWDGERNWA